MFGSAYAVVFAFSALVSAVPTAIPIMKRAGPAKTDSYIVKLKADTSKDSHITRLLSGTSGNDASVIYKWDNTDLFHGYAAVLKGAALDSVRGSPDVEYMEADTVYQIEYEVRKRDLASRPESTATQSNGGSGVVVYGIDTGIYTNHSCFGGRASWGATFGNYSDVDGNGHGTHTAGTIVGQDFGIATSATIIAVKVCADNGSCAMSDMVSGVNYALAQFRANDKPSGKYKIISFYKIFN
ncbi:subtilisin-like serine protease [Ceratobasidium sp. 428]|nr:subtilisin-like serine protease [Ceratobasidium sp. 428]